MEGLLGLFLNPWALLAGGLAVSVPVIIHLINRMQFRRVRWAAMEFLLAAQKKMRRRMILEQLILLLLRIALMSLPDCCFPAGWSAVNRRRRPSTFWPMMSCSTTA